MRHVIYLRHNPVTWFNLEVKMEQELAKFNVAMKKMRGWSKKETMFVVMVIICTAYVVFAVGLP